MALLRWLDKNLELTILALLLAALTFFSFINVVLRYGFSESIIWSDEFCRYCLVISGFMSIPCWLRHKTGLRVDALITLLPELTRKVLDYIVNIFLLFFFCYLLYGTEMVVARATKIKLLAPTLRFPMSYLYIIIGFCFALSVFRLLQMLVEQISSDMKQRGKTAAQTGERI